MLETHQVDQFQQIANLDYIYVMVKRRSFPL